MSQQDNFLGGFLVGTLVGGVVGGVLGVLATSKLNKRDAAEQRKPFAKLEGKAAQKRMAAASPQNIEMARRGLEDKIAQLNDAIDDVRQKLGTTNGVGTPEAGEPTGDRQP
ncbi:hypothetical protein ACQ4M4_17110 [Leptolyngbya sp. AN02str]|uniref:hypothetical protein n=1 Tax=Leptolyngbya sp. AN02str TaxID=3423363 RepID=UPI003D320CD1